jgi:hypothetical protein
VQRTDSRGLAALERRVAQQQQAEGGRDRECDHQRRDDGQGVREQHRRQERARQPVGEQQRHHRGEGDHGRVQQRRPQVQRRVEDRPPRGDTGAGLTPAAQAGRDARGVGDRVVDDDHQSQRQPRDDHQVDRRTAQVQHEARGRQRQRHRDGGDDRAAPVGEERQQQGQEQDRARERRLREPREGRADELGGTVGRRIELHVPETGLHHLERLVDTACDLRGVRGGELLDDEQQALVVGCGAVGVADQWLVVLVDRGDLTERGRLAAAAQRAALGALERHGRELGGRGDGLLVEHVQPLVDRVDPPAGAR